MRPSTRLAPLLVACAAILAGCSADDHDDHDEDHIGHEIPAHKPRDLPQAVSSIRALAREFGSAPSQTPIARDRVEIAVDVARWLPEIAGDSDLPEKEWNLVNDAAIPISKAFETIAATTGDRSKPIAELDARIRDLEAIISRAEPAWFPEMRNGRPVPRPALPAESSAGATP
ncbi:MAG: hypothetical protein SFX72_13380 [Isosphaeraceae bacterium]|nr:hypothetical protein [Isosphaeraceae bacterium]